MMIASVNREKILGDEEEGKGRKGGIRLLETHGHFHLKVKYLACSKEGLSQNLIW